MRQVFFQDTTVADDASLDFCVPTYETLEKYGEETFGVKYDSGQNKMLVPLHKWDGKLSRDRDVFDPARMDGSAFVGQALSLACLDRVSCLRASRGTL